MTDYYDEDYSGILDGPSVREMLAKELRRGRSPRDTTADQGDNEERGGSTPGEARLERLRREAAVCTTHHAACACGQLAEQRLLELCQRLERENAALRNLAQAVANGPRWMLTPPLYLCNFCNVCVGGLVGRADHRAECPVTKARALVAEKGKEGGA